MPSLDLNIASRLQESRPGRAYGFRAITRGTSSRQASRRSRIEIACRDPVNRPRPTFVNARDRLHPAYSNKVADNELRLRYLRATWVRWGNVTRHLLLFVIEKVTIIGNIPLPLASRAILRSGRHAKGGKRQVPHLDIFILLLLLFRTIHPLTSLIGYRSKCCYTRDTPSIKKRWSISICYFHVERFTFYFPVYFPAGNNKTRDVKKVKDLVVRDYFENLLSSIDKLDSLRESQCLI